MTIIDALDKLECAGYILCEESDGLYINKSKGPQAVSVRDPSLSESLDCLDSNPQATGWYYSGLYD